MFPPNEFYKGQVLQDKFVLAVLKNKRNGFFLELGANEPCSISNTYILEKQFNWKGIMVEYDNKFYESYCKERSNSIPIISDACSVNYKEILETNHFPKSMDYLQIDLEPGNGSTLKALQILDSTVMDSYVFATVTFEHDIYQGTEMFQITREQSRQILERRGYIRVFSDVTNDGWRELDENRQALLKGTSFTPLVRETQTNYYPFEDWYVHPSLVDMDYVKELIEKNRASYKYHPFCGNTINFGAIQY